MTPARLNLDTRCMIHGPLPTGPGDTTVYAIGERTVIETVCRNCRQLSWKRSRKVFAYDFSLHRDYLLALGEAGYTVHIWATPLDPDHFRRMVSLVTGADDE